MLLIDGDAVGGFEVFFHFGQIVANLFKPVFAADVGRNFFHRPRAVECYHGHNIFEIGGFEGFEVFAHPRRFQLKNANSLPVLQQFVGFRVVEAQCVQIYGNAMALFDQFQGILNNGQGAYSQEVHFEQSGTFDHLGIELGNQKIGFVELGNRNQIYDGLGCDNITAGMQTTVSDSTFHRGCDFHGLAQFFVVFDNFLEFFGFVQGFAAQAAGS